VAYYDAWARSSSLYVRRDIRIYDDDDDVVRYMRTYYYDLHSYVCGAMVWSYGMDAVVLCTCWGPPTWIDSVLKEFAASLVASPQQERARLLWMAPLRKWTHL
jgi:hypothetical protein